MGSDTILFAPFRFETSGTRGKWCLIPIFVYGASMEQCPWDSLRAAGGVPNIDWCEEGTCAWIDEPANTWSNVAYFVVALMLFLGRREGQAVLVRFFPFACLMLGAFSFAYHASLTFVLQVFDFLGMFLFLYIPITLNLQRMKIITRQVPTYLALIAGSLAILLVLRGLGLKYQLMIAVGVVALLITEPLAIRRSGERGKLWFLAASVGALIVAATFSALDISRVFCDPNDHLVQGHAIWHLFSALSLGLAYVHYASLTRLTS